MSIWSLLGAALLQGMLAYLLFMLVVFWGAGLANGRNLARWQIRVLDLAMFAVPGSCVVLVLFLAVRYWREQPAPGWWWHLLPLLAFAAFAAFARSLHAKRPPGD